MDVTEMREVDLEFAREDWVTEELEAALDALPTPKHRTTVLRLAEGKLIGRPDEKTFILPDVCSKKTWHGPYRVNGRAPGWKDDPRVKKALDLAMHQIFRSQEQGVIISIQEAERILAAAAPKAVMTLEVLLDDENVGEETKRRAANDILDRVSLGGGKKGTGSTVTLSEQRRITFDLSGMSAEVLKQLASGGDEDIIDVEPVEAD